MKPTALLRVPLPLLAALAVVALAVAIPYQAVARTTTSSTHKVKTLRVAFQSDFGTLDPAVGYNFGPWIGEHAIFDALLNYRDAPGTKGTQLIPDIAKSLPKVSRNGLYYTFHLRKGVRFSPPVNRVVTAADFKYSIERSLSKHTPNAAMYNSPFWSPLAGTKAFWSGKAAHISGIKVLNRLTIQFHLSYPDLAFENILAMPFASVVPKEWVQRKGAKRFATDPIGTGPYRLLSWSRGQQMILGRNRNYFRKGLPRIPRVSIQFGVNPHLQILRAEKGQLDLPGDLVSTSDYLALRLSSTYSKQLVGEKDIAVRYLALNTQMKPFKGNLNLRRAINMAINKPHIIRLLNGRGVVMNGIFPPTMPGANKHFTYYKYAPKKAKTLLKKAGYKPGQLHLSLMFDESNADYTTVADAVQADLKRIGVDVSPRPVSDNTYYSLIYTPGKSAFTLGVWGLDYPDPSDFIDPLLTCAGSSNAAFFCNHADDRLATRARGDRNRKQRYALYRKLEGKIMSQAPWAPLYDDKLYDFRGATVKHFFIQPIWGFSYDQYELK